MQGKQWGARAEALVFMLTSKPPPMLLATPKNNCCYTGCVPQYQLPIEAPGNHWRGAVCAGSRHLRLKKPKGSAEKWIQHQSRHLYLTKLGRRPSFKDWQIKAQLSRAASS